MSASKILYHFVNYSSLNKYQDHTNFLLQIKSALKNYPNHEIARYSNRLYLPWGNKYQDFDFKNNIIIRNFKISFFKNQNFQIILPMVKKWDTCDYWLWIKHILKKQDFFNKICLIYGWDNFINLPNKILKNNKVILILDSLHRQWIESYEKSQNDHLYARKLKYLNQIVIFGEHRLETLKKIIFKYTEVKNILTVIKSPINYLNDDLTFVKEKKNLLVAPCDFNNEIIIKTLFKFANDLKTTNFLLVGEGKSYRKYKKLSLIYSNIDIHPPKNNLEWKECFLKTKVYLMINDTFNHVDYKLNDAIGSYNYCLTTNNNNYTSGTLQKYYWGNLVETKDQALLFQKLRFILQNYDRLIMQRFTNEKLFQDASIDLAGNYKTFAQRWNFLISNLN